MSETSKPAETMKKAADQTLRSSHAAMEAAGKASGDALHETVAMGLEQDGRAMHTPIETTAETAAGLGSRVADIGFGGGHRFLATATNAMDIYRDASERSAERVQALFSSYLTFGRGLQATQHAWLEMADQTMGTAARKPRDLLRCKNMVEVAEVQRDLYIGAIDHALESATRLLEMAGQTAQDAIRPLQSNQH